MNAPAPADVALMNVAVSVAHGGGRLAAEHFFTGSRSATKADGTDVTAADLAVEEYIREELIRHTPDDTFLGEELEPINGSSGRRWVIDSIDGTYFFTRRIPLFSTTLAYEDEHGPALSVIAMPIREQIVFAGRGLGCWLLHGPEPDTGAAHRVRVNSTKSLAGAHAQGVNMHTWNEQLLLALHRQVRLRPAFGAGLVQLVTGHAEANVVAGARQGYEDYACAPVLVGEAGGEVTDLRGEPVLAGDGTLLATNGLLHGAFLDLVTGFAHSREPLPERG